MPGVGTQTQGPGTVFSRVGFADRGRCLAVMEEVRGVLDRLWQSGVLGRLAVILARNKTEVSVDTPILFRNSMSSRSVI